MKIACISWKRSVHTFLIISCISRISTHQKSMKCFVEWIPLNICVRSRNTQPYLKFSKASSSRCSELALENFNVHNDAATFLCRSKFSKVRCVVILCSQVRSKLALENLHFNKVSATCLSRRKFWKFSSIVISCCPFSSPLEFEIFCQQRSLLSLCPCENSQKSPHYEIYCVKWLLSWLFTHQQSCWANLWSYCMKYKIFCIKWQ